ncbi:MAG: tripartite tricarboxylate transporter TctB family protein [Salinarimonadaceae bacterium]|nr:MAG: tripartite tricarboxylate transporter TctB family protein [Salinarimonadaceae bacterium]
MSERQDGAQDGAQNGANGGAHDFSAERRMFRVELVVACAFCATGLFVTVYGLATLKFWAVYGPGPAFVPALTGCLLALIGALKAVLLQRARRARVPARGAGQDWDVETLVKPLFSLVLIGATGFAIAWLGTTVGLVIFVLVMALLIERETVTLALIVAAVLPASLVWLFRSALSIPLPHGFFF